MSFRKPFYGWWVLGALMIFSMFGAGTVWYGFTAFLTPMVNELGWSYTAISVAAGMRGVEIGIADIFAGFLVDRFGGRKVICAGTLLMSAGFLLLSQVSSLTTFYVYYLLLCLGVTACASVVAMAILSHWFRRRLGTALGVYSAGGGLSGFLVPLVVYLVDSYGFRAAFLVFGISALVIGLCVAFLIRDRPDALGYASDGGILASDENTVAPGASARSAGGPTTSQVAQPGFKVVLSSRIFWILVLAVSTQVFVLQMLITHIMPYLESVGYSRHAAAQAAMVMPILSVLGRLGFGWLGDRFNRRDMLIILMALQMVGIFGLAYAGLQILLIPFLLIYGIGYGGMVPNRAAIVRDYFGFKSFGSMLGMVVGLSVIGGLFGPIMAGALYDATGSYYSAFVLSTGILVIGTLPLFSLKRPAVQSRV